MREIKFRAWHKTLKVMLNVYVISQEKYDNGYKQNCKGWYGVNNQITFAYDQVEWLQFTGLLDKSGKEIYEGDILKDDCDEILEVKFGKLPLDKSGDCVCTYEAFYCKCYGKLGQSPIFRCCEIGDWMEIIGNVFENKELLGKG